jgi:HlyD family secretion protein
MEAVTRTRSARTPSARRRGAGRALLVVAAAMLDLAAVALAPGCGGEPPPPPPTSEVTRDRIERIVVATGTIEPVKEVEVRPRIAGIVERIHVEAGDDVEAGTLLVEIERELLASRVAEARAALREARVRRRYAATELDRGRRLVEDGARSPQHLDELQSGHDQAEAAAARAEAALRTLATQLSYADVVSPLAARVLDVHVEEGSAVSPVTSVNGGTLLLSLAATETLHLDGLVDENEVARVHVGQPARVRTEAFPERLFEGRVREIAPLGERVQNVTYFRVEIEITDPDAGLLRPRMSGDADIVAEVVEDALVVPETALHYRGGEVFVHTLNGSGLEERPVRVGIVDGARVQILEGAAEGDAVVVK